MTTPTQASSASPQDEMLPFLNNFHDIFTTIGVLILLVGLAMGSGQVMNSLDLPQDGMGWQYAVIALLVGVSVIIWMLSALLVGKQRRILPGIVLSASFSITATIVLIWGYTQLLIHGFGINESMMDNPFQAAEQMEFGREAVLAVAAELPFTIRILPVIMGLSFLIPVAVYYWSFRLPFAGGLAGLGLVGSVVAIQFIQDPYMTIVNLPTVYVLVGVALLVGGIFFDMRDPGRSTRLSGTAFWLHFFAAPILLSAVLNVTQIGWTFSEADFADFENNNLLMAMAQDNGQAVRLAVIALIIIGCFAIISLLINRRALIVSGLLTAGVSIGAVVNATGMDTGSVIAVTLLLLGGVVVLLGAAWNPVRRILLIPFPSTGLIGRIFPPADGSVG